MRIQGRHVCFVVVSNILIVCELVVFPVRKLLQEDIKVADTGISQKIPNTWPIVNGSIFINALGPNADNKTKTANRCVTHKELLSR
jgi:hypothetical protein